MNDRYFFSNDDDSLDHGWDELPGDDADFEDDIENETSMTASRIPSDCLEDAVARCEKYLTEGGRRRAGEELLQALRSFQRVTQTRVRDTVVREINMNLGRLMGCYNGIQCDLYFLEIDADGIEVLRPRFSLGGPRRKLAEIPMSADVLETDAIKNFNPEPSGDKLRVAIPLVGGVTANAALGVLVMGFNPILTRDDSNSNWSLNIAKLQIDAKMLVVHMICYKNLNLVGTAPCLWSPSSHGWSFNGFLADLCQVVVQSQESVDETASYSCSIWNVDKDKSALWLRATSGYDYEFLSQALGSWNSYTASVARQAEGLPYIGPPPDEFVGKEKGKVTGLTTMMSVPLYLNPSDADLDLDDLNLLELLSPGRATHPADQCDDPVKSNENTLAPLVFHTYRFAGWGKEDDLSALPMESDVTELSVLVEDWLMAYERVRKQAALAFLEAKMQAARKEWQAGSGSRSHQPSNVMYHALKEVLVNCLHAEGCSIFRYIPRKQSGKLGKLVLVSTTGVTDYRSVEPQDCNRAKTTEEKNRRPSPFFYDLSNEEHQGLMFYLQQNPGMGVLRLHTIEKSSELPLGCSKVVRRHLEDLSPDTEDRRFMGVAIAIGGEVQIVVRLVRPSNRTPFTKQDEELLEVMVKLCIERNLWRGSDAELQRALVNGGVEGAHPNSFNDREEWEEDEEEVHQTNEQVTGEETVCQTDYGI